MTITRNFDCALTAPTKARADHAKRETSALCRERAAADLLQSAAMITVNQKLRLEASAASWTVRAKLLQRVEDGIASRAAADSAEGTAAPVGDGQSGEATRL